MASALDDALHQSLMNLKANAALLTAGRSPLNDAPGLGAWPGTMPAATMPNMAVMMGAAAPALQTATGGPAAAVAAALPTPPAPQHHHLSAIAAHLPGTSAAQLPTAAAALGLPPGHAALTTSAVISAVVAASAILSVAIDNLSFRYQMSEQDLKETFQRWGSLKSVQVRRDGARDVGVVAFEDRTDASDALRQLNGHICQFDSDAQGVLAVRFGGAEESGLWAKPGPALAVGALPGSLAPAGLQGPAVVSQRPAVDFGLSGAMPKCAMIAPTSSLPPPASSLPTPNGASVNAPGRPVWCCKILLHIDRLHREFPTQVKIVGQNNANVNHVQGQTHCNVLLRGRGSGHLEADGQELPEPMFLWLSGSSEQNGKAALDMVLDLIKVVYEEHQHWCVRHNLGNPGVLEPIVQQNPPILPGAVGLM